MSDAGAARQKAGIIQGITVVIAGFLPILAIISMFPAVPAMIQHFSSDPLAGVKVPSMVTAPGLTIAIVALFMGMLVDRFGRRRLLLFSTFFYGFFGALPFLLDSLDAVYLSRLALGLSEAAILTVLNTLIADYWDESGRRNWLTIQGLAGPALASVVIYFAGSLAEWRWNAIFLLYLIGFPIFIAMLLWMFEPGRKEAAATAPPAAASGTQFPWGIMASIGALTLAASILYYVFSINGGLVWQELGVKDAGEIGRITAPLALFVLAGAAVFWLMGRLKLGSRWQLTTFLLLLGAGMVMMGQARSTGDMFWAMAVQQSGAGMAIPALILWAQGRLPFEHRGRGMGLWAASFFFGQFCSPLVVAAIRTSAGTMQATFATLGFVCLGLAVIAWFTLGKSTTRAA